MPSRVDTASPTVRGAIEAMLDIATINGAEVHSRLQVKERSGQMSVHSDAADGDILVRLPEDLLVPVDDIDWDVSGDRLSVVRHGSTMSSAQRDLVDAHVAVYNATKKLDWARTTLPAVALATEPGAVAAVRALVPAFLEHEQPLARAFIDSRVYLHTPGDARRDPPTESPDRRVLMPIVDLLNHHPKGAPLRVIDGVMTVPVVHATGDSHCFDRYGARRDPIDLALHYGYADRTVSYARSVPVSVDLAGLGTVVVLGQRPGIVSNLDPPHITIEPGRLSLSHVTFDAGHPERILAVLELAVAAYLNRESDTVRDARAASRVVALALANRNLDQLDQSLRRLNGFTAAAAKMLSAAIRAQRMIIEQAIADLDRGADVAKIQGPRV